jgi:hypothetical protein
LKSNKPRVSKTNSFSRRTLLTGLGGIAGSAFFLENSQAASVSNSTPGLDPNVLNATFQYLFARTNPAVGGTPATLSKYFSPGSKSELDFEVTRFSELSNLGASNRRNGKIDQLHSQPQLLASTSGGNFAQVIVSDWTEVDWRPAPPINAIIRNSQELAIVASDPIRYGLNNPSWMPTKSGFESTHLITLEKVAGSWIVTSDTYSDPTIIGNSPNYSPSLIQDALQSAGITQGGNFLRAKSAPGKVPTQHQSDLTSHTFDYISAVNYAHTYAKSYNGAYTNFSPDDCTNFVSQCFVAGAYPTDSSWYKYSTSWKLNSALRSWLISSGRGHDETSSMLGLADCVNYDWTNDGVLDHMAIVTSIVGGTPLVCCHSAAQYDVPYNQIYAPGYMPSQTRKYTGTYLYYSA